MVSNLAAGLLFVLIVLSSIVICFVWIFGNLIKETIALEKKNQQHFSKLFLIAREQSELNAVMFPIKEAVSTRHY